LEPNLSEAERRIEEARKTQAEELDLGDLALIALPASLEDLPHLKRLHLSPLKPRAEVGLDLDLTRTYQLRDLSPLARLQGLESLDLSMCAGVTDLSPLAGLQGLQSLNLSHTWVRDLSPLAGLQELRSLDLESCDGVTDLRPLADLDGLQSLKLGMCACLTSLAPLAGLQGLQSLSFGGTGVTDLAPLAGLRELQSLSFGVTGVTDLAPLAGLQGLQDVYLGYTLVTDLAPLAGLRELRSLDLSFTQVRDLAPLAGLRKLQSLNCYGCRLAVSLTLLKDFACHPQLAAFIADKAAGVPREVLSHRFADNCLLRLRTYLSELDLGAEAENEVKVILLGNGSVGKTQLCRRFRGKPFDESIESTHGVQIWREELYIQAGDQDQAFHVNWWDFGGQDIYHGTHALFLRSRAVFLILWTPALENRDESEENGIPLRNQPVAYWLDYVRSLAGTDSPVIVIQSQCDRFADRRSDPPRPEGFEFFECCSYSAKSDLGRSNLESYLRDAMRYLLAQTGALQIGRGRAKVRQRLYEWRSKDQKYKPAKRRHRTLSLDDFRALCDEVGGIVSWEHALDYLHQTGVVFYDRDLFSNCIVLDQDWALDAVYTVFHRGRAVPWLRESGRFTREDLAATVWQKHSLEEQRLFLGLMKSCGVCFPCEKTAQGEERYVAPDLLPGFEAFAGRRHVLDSWNEQAETPTLRLEYRFFHPAVVRGLMRRIGERAGDLAEYWKYGLWLKDGQRDSQLLVEFIDSSTDETPGAGALEVKAQGHDPLGLLREIRRTILYQRIGEKPEESLTLAGATVARSALTSAIDSRVLDVQGRPVSATAFAAFFEDREHQPDEADRKIDIQPQGLGTGEKRREVFISYSWGDDTAEVVDALYAALEKDGFQPVRDRDEMRPGDLISAFIRRLTRADLVVAVISDKYLRSAYCMHEIHGLWQKSQEDAELMATRLVPIVLPEVRIGNLAERAPYLRYWKTQEKELRKLHRELGPNLDPKSQQEFRLVRSFAQDVDGILVFLQDVLMPRKLDIHFEDGFQAVREALRRRIGLSARPDPSGSQGSPSG
jgi:internalin A